MYRMSAKTNVNFNGPKRSYGKGKMQILSKFNKAVIYIPIQLIKTHKYPYPTAPRSHKNTEKHVYRLKLA